MVEVRIAETAKSLRTLERIVDAFAEFGLMRKEPVLVVGGGLTTDVAGFACASYKRSTDYVRIPTTLIGLIDASVSIKVGANHGTLKNRLGAYHASKKVLLDFSLLRTLPVDQVRNGIAEIIKIATVGDRGIFEALEKYGEELLHHLVRVRRGRRAPARGRRPGHLRRDPHDARARGAQPARARPRPGHRLRPHLEPDAGARARRRRSSTATRSASTWPSRPPWPSSAATSARGRPRPGARPVQPAGAGGRQPVVHPRAAASSATALDPRRPATACCAPPCPRPIGTCHFVNDLTVEELVEALAEHRRSARATRARARPSSRTPGGERAAPAGRAGAP